MWKTVVAGTAALAIAGTAIAYAHPSDRARDHAQGWRPSAQDIAAFGDARIAALHAGLELSAEQEKNWPAVESAMRGLAKQRSERVAARGEAKAPGNPVERLSRRADAMESRGAALKKLADAAAPLYGSLSDAQKHRFMVLARLGARPGHGHHGARGRHEGRGPGGWQHHHRGPQGSSGEERGPGPQ